MARIRLQRYLSQAGVAARRKAERLITEGKVKVNGEVVTELGTRVDPDVDRVQVEGEAISAEDYFYAVFNKPKGCVTTLSDPEGRITVMDYLPGVPASVKPVGRLDYYSEGVLLLTNDGELSAALLAPATHAEKTYHVKLKGKLKQHDLEALRKGVRLDDGSVTRPALIDRLTGAGSRHEWLVITLVEGKSRQIHRMARALGIDVLKIQRVAFAGIDFHGLRVGDARELTQAEVSGLRALAGLAKNPRAVGRGKWSVTREDSELARRAKLRAAQREAEAAEPKMARRPPKKMRAEPGRQPQRPRRGQSRTSRSPTSKSSARQSTRSPARQGSRSRPAGRRR
jgi:23S rRNA pseudouridine2605 synthase